MKRWSTAISGLAALLSIAIGSDALAQVVSSSSAAPPQKTIWGLFGLSSENLSSCRTKFASTELGSLFGNGLRPVSQLTGGLIGGANPGSRSLVVAAASAGGANGAQAASVQIQQYQASSKATLAAIAYLSTVDCHYWPEAEKALIDALRANRVECVRFAAAEAFERGCCCSKKTIEALRIVVDGSEEDGNPSETSPRVRATAFRALQRCLCRPMPAEMGDAVPAPLEPPVPAIPVTNPATTTTANLSPAPSPTPTNTYYSERLKSKTDRQVIASAWQSLARSPRVEPTIPASVRADHPTPKPRSAPKPVAVPSTIEKSPKDVLILLPGSPRP